MAGVDALSSPTEEIDLENTQELSTAEGKAHIFSPATVFYNPVQEFNRDLTIAVVTQFARDHFINLRRLNKVEEGLKEARQCGLQEAEQAQDSCGKPNQAPNGRSSDSVTAGDISEAQIEETGNATDSLVELNLEAGKCYEDGVTIMEGLAATGLRSVRFALEVPGLKKVVANDYSKTAVEYIKRNIEHNGVGELVEESFSDAAILMYQSRRHADRFDVVDVDPYGSPAVFIDAAVQAVRDGGLLCVTCTDLATLCGNFPETCHSKYGSIPLKGKFCHEMALRIMLQSIEVSANRYSRYIVPLLSVSADFYIRIFVKVYTGQFKVKDAITKISMMYVCSGCGAFHLQPMGVKHAAKGEKNFKYTAAQGPPVTEQCDHCSFKHHVGGPIWSDRIHDAEFVKKVVDVVNEDPSKLGTSQRITGMLSVISEELADVPLYYVTDELCKTVHCSPPTQLQIR